MSSTAFIHGNMDLASDTGRAGLTLRGRNVGKKSCAVAQGSQYACWFITEHRVNRKRGKCTICDVEGHKKDTCTKPKVFGGVLMCTAACGALFPNHE